MIVFLQLQYTCLNSVVGQEFNIISSSHDSAPSSVGSTMGSGDRLQVRYSKGSYKDVNENDEDHRDGDGGVVIVTSLVILLAETRTLENYICKIVQKKTNVFLVILCIVPENQEKILNMCFHLFKFPTTETFHPSYFFNRKIRNGDVIFSIYIQPMWGALT